MATNKVSVWSCLSKKSKEIIYKEIKDRLNLNTIMLKIGGFDGRYYPAEVILTISRYQRYNFKDYSKTLSTLLQNMEIQLNKENSYLTWPHDAGNTTHVFGENTQGRLVLASAQLYQETKIPSLKNIVTRTYFALSKLPDVKVYSKTTNKSYYLPAYSYRTPIRPELISGRTLDPNHEATLAAAYFYASQTDALSPGQRSLAVKRARYYFHVSFALVDSNCLPLADQPGWITACDTRYNAFWIYWVSKLQKYLGNSETERQMMWQESVLSKYSRDFKTHRVYPNEYTGPYLDPIEPFTLAGAVARYASSNEWASWIETLDSWIFTNRDKSNSWPIGLLIP